MLLAGRALVHGARRPALLLALAAAAALAAGVGLALLVPASLAGLALLLLPLWGGTGFALAVAEARLGLAPSPEPEPARLRDVPAWVLAVAVGGFPVALGLALLFTRWGTALYAKPSFPATVLRLQLLVPVPAGAVFGLARVAARRTRRPAVPVAFAGLFPLAGLLMLPTGLVFHWLRQDVLRLPDMDADPVGIDGGMPPSSW